MGFRLVGIVIGIGLGIALTGTLHFMVGDKETLMDAIRSLSIIFLPVTFIAAAAYASEE